MLHDQVTLESIPLIAQMLGDPDIPVILRGVDNAWAYHGVIPHVVSGFNPQNCAVYCAVESAFGRWLAAPETPLRELNTRDRLMREALFAVHDYLHAWSARLIGAAAPQVGFGVAPIGAANFEDHVFCQLLTETAATIGLDYWYLARVDVSRLVPIGTCMRTLTTAYREEHVEEYRRYCPALDVQNPAFFEVFARFYCTGRLPGFRGDSLTHSPRVLAWIEHELRYGQLQRRYTRKWLAYLSDGAVPSPARAVADAAVDPDVPWRRDLVALVGDALWRLVHEGSAVRVSAPVREASVVPANGPIDFRFTNLAGLDDPWHEIRRRGVDSESYPWLFAQIVSAHRFDAVDPEVVEQLPVLRDARAPTLVRRTLESYPSVALATREPSALFLLP